MTARGRPAIGTASRAVLLLAAAAVGGCMPGAATPDPTPARPEGTGAPASVIERLDAIGAAVTRWRSAGDLVTAQGAAEEARNLVVGPFGPLYGDADGDGTVEGESEIGLLPGFDGQPGEATPELGSCVIADVLGGDWTDAGARWDIMLAAIDEWTPANNTFPTLPSHAQRLVGWATLALETEDLAAATEYGGHAQLHLDITRRAVEACPG